MERLSGTAVRARGELVALLCHAGGAILMACARGKGHLVSLVDTHEQAVCSAEGELRVRELLRLCGQTRDRGERAALMARIAVGLDQAADEIAADAQRALRYGEVIAGLRGQAGMARVAAAFDRERRHHSAAC